MAAALIALIIEVAGACPVGVLVEAAPWGVAAGCPALTDAASLKACTGMNCISHFVAGIDFHDLCWHGPVQLNASCASHSTTHMQARHSAPGTHMAELRQAEHQASQPGLSHQHAMHHAHVHAACCR